MRRAAAIAAAAAPLLCSWLPTAPPAGGDEPGRAFAFEVLPLLQRLGCASAYCHGAASGQGGFHLSLFGSDPEADYAAIAHELGGRRIDRAEPERSLLLRKPTLGTRHGGGRRFAVGSDVYERLRRWIAAGAPLRADDGEQLTDLRLVRDGDAVRALATFAAAGGERDCDVTALALLEVTDPTMLQLDPASAALTVSGCGEAWVVARYAGRSARLRVLRPFADAAGETDAAAPTSAFDAAVIERLRELGLHAAPRAEPEALARRLWLDLVGRPPTPFELQRHLAQPEGERIARSADRLLASSEFVDWFTARVASWLEQPPPDEAQRGARDRVERVWNRIRRHLADDEPWPELTRDLLAPRTGFLGAGEDPRDQAERTARTLLGLRIGCARCHDHPLDRWRRDDHMAFSACFASAAPPPAADGEAMAMAGTGLLYHPDTGEAVRPRLLPLGEVAELAPGADLRAAVHAFLHDEGHDQAARHLANRAFATLFGRGLVEPVDDHRLTNPARHESWLAALQRELHAGGMRLRPLLRALVTSRAWACTSGSDGDAAWNAARAVRRLDADELRRAATAALGLPAAATPALPRSPLALELAVLHGDLLGEANLRAADALPQRLALIGGSDAELLDQLFLSCLTRAPTAAERDALLPVLRDGDRDDALRTVTRSLLLTREFRCVR